MRIYFNIYIYIMHVVKLMSLENPANMQRVLDIETM